MADAVTDPVEMHVDGLGAFLLDGVICDASRGGIIGDDRSQRLGVSEFFEANANGAGFLGIVENGGQFSFSGGRYNFFEDLTRDVNRPVWVRNESVGVAFTKEVEPGPARAGIGFGQVGTVGFDGKEHVTGGNEQQHQDGRQRN